MQLGRFAGLLLISCSTVGCAWFKADPLAVAQARVTNAALAYQTCMNTNRHVESMCPAEREEYERASAASIAANTGG